MINFKEENGTLYKYNITYEEVELEALLREMIINTSIIRSKEEETTWWPYGTDGHSHIILLNHDRHVFDVIKEQIGEIDRFECTSAIYKVKYKEYELSQLSKLLVQFLKEENMDLLDYLNESSDAKTPYEIIQNELKEEKIKLLASVNDLDTWGLEIGNDKLKRLKEELILNENQKSEKEYYSELKKYFNIKLIDQLDLKTINRVEEFKSTDIKKLTKSISKK